MTALSFHFTSSGVTRSLSVCTVGRHSGSQQEIQFGSYIRPTPRKPIAISIDSLSRRRLINDADTISQNKHGSPEYP